MIITQGLGNEALITSGYGWLEEAGGAPPPIEIPAMTGGIFRKKKKEDEDLEVLLALIGELS